VDERAEAEHHGHQQREQPGPQAVQDAGRRLTWPAPHASAPKR
jgi:hypothetical protein